MWTVFFWISAACESGNCSPSISSLSKQRDLLNTIGSISCDRLHYFISTHFLFHKAYSFPSLAGSAWHIHSSSWLIGDWPLSGHHIGAAHGWVSQSFRWFADSDTWSGSRVIPRSSVRWNEVNTLARIAAASISARKSTSNLNDSVYKSTAIGPPGSLQRQVQKPQSTFAFLGF